MTKGRSMRIRVGADKFRCPDCNAEPDDGYLVHEPSCPISIAEDQTAIDDENFFVTHPNTDYFMRPMTRTELDMMNQVADKPFAAGKVRVRRVNDDLRSREFIPDDPRYIPAAADKIALEHLAGLARREAAGGPKATDDEIEKYPISKEGFQQFRESCKRLGIDTSDLDNLDEPS